LEENKIHEKKRKKQKKKKKKEQCRTMAAALKGQGFLGALKRVVIVIVIVIVTWEPRSDEQGLRCQM
jgi:hypothetical protein